MLAIYFPLTPNIHLRNSHLDFLYILSRNLVWYVSQLVLLLLLLLFWDRVSLWAWRSPLWLDCWVANFRVPQYEAGVHHLVMTFYIGSGHWTHVHVCMANISPTQTGLSCCGFSWYSSNSTSLGFIASFFLWICYPPRPLVFLYIIIRFVLENHKHKKCQPILIIIREPICVWARTLLGNILGTKCPGILKTCC